MRADRLLSLLLLLQARGRMTAAELAREVEVSERTIYRDLDALSAAGVPVYAERGPGGGCELLAGYQTKLTGLTEEEIRALFMAAVPGPLGELGLTKAASSALLKLTAALPLAHRPNPEWARQRFHLDPAPWQRPGEAVPHLQTLQQAVWQDRCLRLEYRRGNGSSGSRTVEPLGLVTKANIWYVVLRLSEGGEMRVYRVSRIVAADLLPQTFSRPPDFDLRDYWQAWCSEFEASLPRYETTLRLAPELVPVLPHIFGEGVHEVIRSAKSADADGWLTIPLVFETLVGATRAVLGLGSAAQVVSPPELRAAVLAEAERTVAAYRAA